MDKHNYKLFTFAMNLNNQLICLVFLDVYPVMSV